MIKTDYFSPDILELLNLFSRKKVEYLIVGGEAVIYYGYPRLTGDIDLFYRNTQKNIEALFNALLEFWDGDIPGIKKKAELAKPGYVIQFGVPPNRIDFLNEIEGINFSEAWDEKKTDEVQVNKTSVSVYFIGLKHLIINKEMTGRPKDQEDLTYLKSIR